MTDLSMTTTYPMALPQQPHGVRRVLLDTGYNLSAFVLALVAFVLVVTDLALGLGLSVLIGGVLLLSVGVMVARGFARFERIRMRGMLGREAATPAYVCAGPDDGFWRRQLTPLRDPQSWLDVVWSLVGLVTGTAAFSIAVAWWAGTVGGLSYWFWQRYLPDDGPDDHGLAYYLGFGDGRTAESWVNLGIGIVLLLTLPLAMRFGAVLHSSLASALLCSRAELQREVARVEGGRDAARMAEAESLRRLERDIHDGPQQRLVRLTMDLGRAKRQLGQDPERASETLDDALAQARETVAELRSLSRGIAPPLLVDRGLAAALEEMLVQSVVPVESRIDVPPSLPPHVETAVYFVVAEALTNIAKHSEAGSASVAVTLEGDEGDEGDEVVVRVEDDGVGGAHPAKGLGLAGLRQRLAAVDGTLELTSPEGGPTVVLARIPR
ncbi:sensor histidine kinase [Nocardioides sp.]|uniref:sensor histidine kinase n=1 Tax=Nocardioides sp. TaxID=35761 RepID=UPI002ED934C8